MITSSKITMNKELSQPIPLGGGLNEQVSNMELSPGELIICQNYVDQEDIYSGYTSARGYERYSGLALASTVSVTETDGVYDDTAREAQRALILTVGGTSCTGQVRGAHVYNDHVYAWRNKADDSENYMYIDSAAGWVIVDTSADKLTASGDVKAVNGRFSLYASNAEVMVFVDGVTKGVYFYNGTTISFIDNASTGGLLPDLAPINVGIWRNRLFVVYDKGHILFSAPGDPTDFDTSTSTAGEIYLGADCTALAHAPNGTLAIFTKESVKLLYYATVTEDWVFKLDDFSDEVGAIEGTAHSILGDIFFADTSGLCNLATTQTYGDFGAKNISKKVQNTYAAYRNYIQFSIVDADTGRYYLFYADPTSTKTSGLVFTFKGTKLKGTTRVVYTDKMSCITRGTLSTGSKVYYFGTTDGYVMKMFSGTSFDGDAIESVFSTSYYHYNSPRIWKFFHRLKFETSSSNNITGEIRARYNYSETIMPRVVDEDFSVQEDVYIYGAGGYWDDDFFDTFYWSAAAIGGGMYYFTGYGTSLSITVRVSSKYYNPHAFHNLTVDYSLQSVQV